MKNKIITTYWVLTILSLFSIIGIYYWEIKYILDIENPGRHEFLAGSAIVTLFSAPFWLSYMLFSLVCFKFLSKLKVALSIMLVALVLLPIMR